MPLPLSRSRSLRSRSGRLFRVIRTLSVGMLAGALVTVASATLEPGSAAEPNRPAHNPSDGRTQVVYEVRSTDPAARADVLFRTGPGRWKRVRDVPLPWVLEFRAVPEAHLWVSAELAGSEGGITAAISVDGTGARSTTAEGARASAHVDLWLPAH